MLKKRTFGIILEENFEKTMNDLSALL